MSCRSIRPWLHVERGALGEADRLVLEEHLQACERCRADRERLALVRRIGAALPAASIGPRGHGRAIARALMAGPREPAPARRRVPRWAVAVAVAVAVAGATAMAASLVVRSGGADAPQAPSPTAPSEHLSLPRPPAAPAPAPVAPPPPSSPPAEVTPRAPAPAPPAAKPGARRLLAQAREAFARGEHAAAERLADAALDASPARAQAAEARTLLAECAHATGRLDDALRRYEAIVARFGDLPAGETALFAAARLEASRGRAEAARALLERYLERYPSGRFAGDARRHTRAPR